MERKKKRLFIVFVSMLCMLFSSVSVFASNTTIKLKDMDLEMQNVNTSPISGSYDFRIGSENVASKLAPRVFIRNLDSNDITKLYIQIIDIKYGINKDTENRYKDELKKVDNIQDAKYGSYSLFEFGDLEPFAYNKDNSIVGLDVKGRSFMLYSNALSNYNENRPEVQKQECYFDVRFLGYEQNGKYVALASPSEPILKPKEPEPEKEKEKDKPSTGHDNEYVPSSTVGTGSLHIDFNLSQMFSSANMLIMSFMGLLAVVVGLAIGFKVVMFVKSLF